MNNHATSEGDVQRETAPEDKVLEIDCHPDFEGPISGSCREGSRAVSGSCRSPEDGASSAGTTAHESTESASFWLRTEGVGGSLLRVIQRWRDEADRYERDQAQVAGDKVLRRVADEAEHAFAEWWTEPLDISEASDWTDYSESHLRKLIREGKLRDVRNEGRLRVRRCDLPRKATSGPPVDRVASSGVRFAMQEAQAVANSE